MLRKYGFIEYEVVGITEVEVEYVPVSRTGVKAYSMRIKLYESEYNTWVLFSQLFKMHGLYS